MRERGNTTISLYRLGALPTYLPGPSLPHREFRPNYRASDAHWSLLSENTPSDMLLCHAGRGYTLLRKLHLCILNLFTFNEKQRLTTYLIVYPPILGRLLDVIASRLPPSNQERGNLYLVRVDYHHTASLFPSRRVASIIRALWMVALFLNHQSNSLEVFEEHESPM